MALSMRPCSFWLAEGRDNVSVLIYFWDDRDGPSFGGWWFGPKIGGDQVWAYHPDKTSQTPPKSGWKVPYDGPVDATMILTPKAPGQAMPQQQMPQQQQQQQWAQQQQWGQQQQGGMNQQQQMMMQRQRLEENKRKLEEANKKRMAEQQAKMAELKQKQQMLQQKAMEEKKKQQDLM